MELVIRHFNALTVEELYAILQLRCGVFIVEQSCVYQDLDGYDGDAFHIFLRDADGIQAYLRVLRPGTRFPEASIGRVVAVKRRRGYASRILAEGIRVAREEFGAETICLEAQLYARSLYEKQGFVAVSDPFLEDGIPHIKMRLTLGKPRV